MKRRCFLLLMLFLSASVLLLCAGCGQSGQKDDDGMLIENSDYQVSIIPTSYVEQPFSCLNVDRLTISSVRHLPICKVESAEELSGLLAAFPLRETEMTDEWDEDFFADNVILAAYLSTGSSAFRYAVTSVYCRDGRFCLNVEQTNDPEVYTADMVGWLILISLPQKTVEAVDDFDAVLN